MLAVVSALLDFAMLIDRALEPLSAAAPPRAALSRSRPEFEIGAPGVQCGCEGRVASFAAASASCKSGVAQSCTGGANGANFTVVLQRCSALHVAASASCLPGRDSDDGRTARSDDNTKRTGKQHSHF